jgi:uncharacterized protein YutE (UPF0331/DUF86 family)
MHPNQDVLLNKAQIIERCVARAREEYAADTAHFATNHTRQDAAVLNIQRACEAALDVAQHIIATQNLGLAQSARDSFAMLQRADIIGEPLSVSLQAMVGFRNIAVHDYQTLDPAIIVSVITVKLNDLLAFSTALLKRFQPVS